MREAQLELVLFALTGIGNPVLQALVDAGIAPDLIVTRAENGPYPYDPQIAFIGDLATQVGIRCLFDLEGESIVRERGADLLLVATYHRKLGSKIIAGCNTTVNLHPSLLPAYRGPNPFFWSLRNGATSTGVTAHALTEELDAGDIYLQKAIDIHDNETQSTLRRRLADLAASVAVTIVRNHRHNRLTSHPQSKEGVTNYPPVRELHRQLDLATNSASVVRQINALRDWPLAVVDDRRIRRVLEIAPFTRRASPGSVHEVNGRSCWLHTADAEVLVEFDRAPNQ